MQAVEINNMQQGSLHMKKYHSQNQHRWLVFETNDRFSFYLYLILNFDAVVRNCLSAVHNGRPDNNEDANK